LPFDNVQLYMTTITLPGDWLVLNKDQINLYKIKKSTENSEMETPN